MNSIISFPARGPWGSSSWRGNCSGYVIKELVEHFKPRLFVDVCEGSGTSRDVCHDLGVEYRGFDLHSGVDFTSDYIARRLPNPADICFSHPPYGAMIQYSGVGKFADPSLAHRDTSASASIEEFLEKSRIMLLNQREATKTGGVYCSLIGDLRTKGTFRSFQSDFISMMPTTELISVVIKAQHNVTSKPLRPDIFVPIMHEYLLIWKRSVRTLVQVTLDGLCEIKSRTAMTWRSLVRISLMKLGGFASLADIYEMVRKEAGEKIASNQNWMAKIRQVLQIHFESVQRGVWAIPNT